jgi:branched-chain amino acid transport system substrate-binding protein
VSNDAVWAINPDLTVSRIDPRTNREVARVANVKALTIAAGEGRVWIVDDGASVAEIDTTTNRVLPSIEVPTDSLTALAVGAGAVWVANPLGGSVWRIDSEPDPLLHEIPLALGVGSVAFGAQAVWATNEIAGEVYRIDPSTNRARVVSRTAAPHGVAFGAGAVWVTAGGPPSPDKSLPASACGRAVPGGATSSQLMLVSNLPLRGTWRDTTVPMVEAIRFVLERRGFKAGRFHVGYQSCDESTAQAHGFEYFRCYSNAKAFARKPNVIGVIGAHSSFCSSYQIPIANQAPGGPLAMISPSNTWTGLTRPYQGMRRGELEARYPSRARNYVRIAAADHLQAAADAELARQLGSKRLFVLSYGDDPYLSGFAANVSRAARHLGLEIAGAGAWNPEARDFSRLARRIGRGRADAVFIGGHLAPNGGELVRDLRAHLGHEVDLIATDYFWTIPDLTAAAGSAAEGTYVSVFGLPNSELPPKGKQFLTDFEATRGGDPGPSFAAAYAAQATEIMLDAIARSDGTRTSVTRELQRTRIDHGILGNIRFDQYGDLLEGPFTILRVTKEAPRNAIMLPQFKGAVVDRVITARPGPLR